MSEEADESKIFCIERARQGRASCKGCKEKCPTGELRIAKLVPSPFGEGKMKNWYHLDCIFQQFLKQRVTTKRIESQNDIDDWEQLNDADKTIVLNRIEDSETKIADKYGLKRPLKQSNNTTATVVKPSTSKQNNDSSLLNVSKSSKDKTVSKDSLFKEFRRIVADISNVSAYLEKTNILKKFFQNGSDGSGFKGNPILWCRLLLPGVVTRVYNLQSKQLIKLFSKIFGTSQNAMLEHLKSGDIGETIQEYFEQSKKIKPAKKSTLTLERVDKFLSDLSELTKEEEQTSHFESITPQCTGNDLKIIIRLIKHDLRMNAGAKHILDAIHPDAYSAYQASRDISAVIKRCMDGSKTTDESKDNQRVKASVSLMTPVQPMLAEACKSVEQAMKKCPNGMYSEIKYDGERVQVHKEGSTFKYFTRNLKPVLPHKIAHFKDFIPKAFPHAKDLILDSEILMIDTITGKPLPFGTLGVHKKSQFQDANVCLFVFDCIFYNGVSLVDKPLKYRKGILKDNMTEIPNHIMFSELQVINKKDELSSMIAKVLKMGLEGLVLKDIESIYEPGKRHWLKVKKDYLHDGAMADSADLIVLGAWYGTGRKAGMKSVFLMGCYDSDKQQFCTVTKVHTGHDDGTLEKLQDELKMIEINNEPSRVPDWLKCTRCMIPDFVAIDPKQQPVWEITGAEFTQNKVHSADGISIRFPRVTMIRGDKDWTTATSLAELKKLFHTSKQSTDFTSFLMDLKTKVDYDVDVKVKIEPIEEETQEKGGKKKRKRDRSLNETKNETDLHKYFKKEPKSPSDVNVKIPAVEIPTVEIVNPLPDIFKDVKLLVEYEENDFADLLRHFVAYDGEIIPHTQWNLASHVLHLRKSISHQKVVCVKDARHVNIDWIKDSIANKQLQDFRPYTVFWKSIKH